MSQSKPRKIYSNAISAYYDLISGTCEGAVYESKTRRHDPTGFCKHGFAVEKPCIPCERKGNAKCVFCYDFGLVILPAGGHTECLCSLDLEFRN